MVLIVMYCFLLSTYHYFLGIDIVGMEFLYMMTWSWSWSCWLADCKKIVVELLGLLLAAGLMLLCCFMLYFCLLVAHMTTQALNETLLVLVD